MRLQKFTENFLEIYKKPHIKPSTYERYKTCLKHIPNIKISKLSQDRLQMIFNDMIAADQSASSIKQVKILLSQALEHLAESGKRVSGDIKRVKIPKIQGKKVVSLTENEQNRLFFAAKNSFYGDFFLALLYTGLRVGELIALDWEDVNLREGYFEISKTAGRGYTTTPKTVESARRLPLNALFRDLLVKRYTLGAKGRIFRNTRGGCINYRSLLDSWHRVLAAADIPPLGLHVLRHTYATCALRAGVDVKVLSKLLGHASVAVTLDLYCDVFDDDKEAASVKIVEFFAVERSGAAFNWGATREPPYRAAEAEGMGENRGAARARRQ